MVVDPHPGRGIVLVRAFSDRALDDRCRFIDSGRRTRLDLAFPGCPDHACSWGTLLSCDRRISVGFSALVSARTWCQYG